MKTLGYLSLLTMVLSGAFTAGAIPAKMGVRTVEQPDGTLLGIKMIGDGSSHFAVTEDGFLLTLDKDGFYRLAEISDEGMIISTGAVPGNKNNVKGKKIEEVNLSTIKANKGIRKAPQTGMGMYKTNYPTTGSPRVPVFLVQYSDVKFSEDFDVKEYFTNMVSGDDFTMFGGTGSIAQYFRDQSNGLFTPQFDVYGPVTLPNTQAYYGGNYGQPYDPMAHYMVSDAASILDPEVDFSQYDADNDGTVDFVYVIYAGQGEHNQGGIDTVWPHAGYLSGHANFKKVDNKWLDQYACSNELEGDIPAGIGAFIHEYSHVIGLPDLYTTDMTVVDRDFTPGLYTVLDYGVYNNDSRTPPNYTAYERNALGWNEPLIINEAMNVEMANIATGQFGLIPTSKGNEFFLVENRQLEGWDTYIPNHGMLIWHIDYQSSSFKNNNVNTKRDHQLVRLVKANNEESFLKYSDGFPFPGTSSNTSFTFETTPAMATWAGEDLGLPITDIAETADGLLNFKVAGGSQDGTNAIIVPENDEDMPEYFNLQGQKIDAPLPGSIVIERRGSSVRKILL